MPRDEEVHEPADRIEAEDWLTKARQDIEAAATLLEAGSPLPMVAMFHAQQAAEKSWKAVLAWHAEAFRKTHDLRELGDQVVRVEAALGELAVAAEALTPFAWVFRYPGERAEPTLQNAHEALATARRVYEAARARVR
jgi:HEPN domain-containing protein